MGKIFKYCFIILHILACYTSVKAQEIHYSEPIRMIENSVFDLVGKVKNQYVLLEHDKDTPTMLVYDASMKLVEKKKLVLDKRKTTIFGTLPSKEDFSIFYVFEKDKKNYIKVNKYTAKGILVDSMTIGELPFISTEYKPAIINSQDKRSVLIYYKEAHHVLHAIVFKVDMMQILWDKALKVKELGLGDDFRQIILTNEGSMYLLSNVKDENLFNEDTQKAFLLYYFDKTNEKITYKNINLPDGIFYFDVKFEYDEVNRALQAGGLYSDQKNGRANGFLHIAVNSVDSFDIATQPFDDDMVSGIKSKKVVKNKGIDDLDVTDIIMRRDGGMIMVCEIAKEYYRRSAQGYYSVRPELMPSVDFYNDDIIVAAFNPDGSLHWRKVMAKRQYAQDDEKYFASYFIAKNAGNLRFIYNEDVKLATELGEYVLEPDGEFRRKVLLNTGLLREKVLLRVRDAIQTDANEIIVPSEWRGKLRLVRIVLDAV